MLFAFCFGFVSSEATPAVSLDSHVRSKMRSLKQNKIHGGPCREKVSRPFRMRSGDRQTERETEWNGVAENEAKKVKIVVRIQASAVLSRSRDRGKRFVISERE